MTEHEKALAEIEFAECAIESGKIERAHEHIHSAISRMGGEPTGEIKERIEAVMARLA